ncbi:g11543 [Coccomyxa viridis]|uniref:G11543 protein n=1 Tax=Coccomyxa viridis TaxID=1274662 RepID=A0ABP1GDV6_9CHLO
MVRQDAGVEKSKQKAKFVLLGEGRVGKTSLVSRIIHNTFNDSQQATVQAAFTSKTVEVDKQQVEVAFWDTAGQERFHSLAPLYYRDADAALLVYDITDKQTLQQVQNWVKELQAMVGAITLTILGNKSDMAKQQAVAEEEARGYAQSIGAEHHYVSAKTGEGISAALRQTVHRVLQRRSQHVQQHPQSYMPGRRQGGLVIAPEEDPVRKQSACC